MVSTRVPAVQKLSSDHVFKSSQKGHTHAHIQVPLSIARVGELPEEEKDLSCSSVSIMILFLLSFFSIHLKVPDSFCPFLCPDADKWVQIQMVQHMY